MERKKQIFPKTKVTTEKRLRECVRLFNTDSEEDDVSGFNAVEEDEDGDKLLFLSFLSIGVTGTVGKTIYGPYFNDQTFAIVRKLRYVRK